MIIVVKADEDCKRAVKTIPIKNKTNGLEIELNKFLIVSESLKPFIELTIKSSDKKTSPRPAKHKKIVFDFSDLTIIEPKIPIKQKTIKNFAILNEFNATI
ncbi:unknown [Firmicutes bacterium CAG:449]|nr:unknown [Firmicutes bacterium CAG:449]